MRILAIAVLAWTLPLAASAQETAAFLKIGVGARAIGMGGAFTAVADDVNAVAWNPAGLSSLPKRELGLMHTEMVARTRYDFIGYAQPTRVGTFAAGARHLSQGRIDGRDAAGRPTGGFSAADTAVDLAYALRLAPGFHLGGGVRYIQSSIAEASARTVAFDLGGLYQLTRLGPGVPLLGLAVQNLGPGMRFLDASSPLPLTLAAGLAYRLPVGLTVAVDYRHRPYAARSSDVSVGTEYVLLAGLALRAGYASGQGLTGGSGISGLRGVAGGFGVRAYGYDLDYSITPFGELGNAHRFSVGARF